MGRAHQAQVAEQQTATARLLHGAGSDPAWEAPFVGPESGFRNKAKMMVAGTLEAPTLGILDPRGRGVDLRGCGLHEPSLRAALPALAAFVTRAGLTPYDVASRRGELKHVLATVSPDGELMVRWVLRSTEPVLRIRKHLGWLHEQLPALRVASVNLQPAHAALLEGPEEVLLTEQGVLSMRLPTTRGPLDLGLRPQGFFQTNSAVAAELYATAGRWIDDLAPAHVVDLYCGVGGFALTAALAGVPDVLGVEVSAEAVAAARESARPLATAAGVGEVRFEVGDATAYAVGAGPGGRVPDLVVLNPPRRGIGPALAAALETSAVPHVLYSSCHAGSLARDLAAMPSLVAVRARLLDMFPQTPHHEVLVLASRPGALGQ